MQLYTHTKCACTYVSEIQFVSYTQINTLNYTGVFGFFRLVVYF